MGKKEKKLGVDTKKTKLDFDRKKHNYVLKKKNKKRKGSREYCTAANPPQKPTHKAQRGGYAAVQPFHKNKKSICSSAEQIEI
jgi:hypothetical protein